MKGFLQAETYRFNVTSVRIPPDSTRGYHARFIFPDTTGAALLPMARRSRMMTGGQASGSMLPLL